MKDLERFGNDPEFVDYYDHDKFEQALREEIKNVAWDEGITEGRKVGRKEGHTQGLEEGLEQGIEQGLEQGIKKQQFSTINIMLNNGEDLEKISLYSGLPIEQILQIKEEPAEYQATARGE